jgi:hypothetical protein
MQSSIWPMLLAIFIAGGVGGIVNALMTDNGFLMPRQEVVRDTTIYRPGCLGNVIIGGVGALISWGLYGPLSAYQVLGTSAGLSATNSGADGVSLAALVGAILIGVSGARWLTNEVDKTLLRAAAAEAANAKASPNAAQQIMMAPPAQALNIAKMIQQAPIQ